MVIADPKNCKLKLKIKIVDNNAFLSGVFFVFVFHIVHLETNISLPYKKKERKINKRKTKRKKVP